MASKKANDLKKTPVNKRRKKKVKFIASSKILLITILIMTTYALGSLGKYTVQMIQESYLESKNFYFKSNIITDNRQYVLNNWDGSKDYTFVADILNYKNDQLWTKTDITYDVEVSTSDPSKAICEVSGKSTERILKTNESAKTKDTLTFNLKGVEGATFNKGDYIDVFVKAKTKAPYEKTLEATFRIYVTSLDLNYYVIDSEGSNYCTLYVSTSTANKKININCDYTKVLIDNTNSYVQNGEVDTVDVNETLYITKLKNMSIEKDNVYAIRFYKVDNTKNYQQDTTAINVE